MIYLHQKRAIEYITEKFRADPDVYALIISGSIAHWTRNSTCYHFSVVYPVLLGTLPVAVRHGVTDTVSSTSQSFSRSP